MHQPWLLAGTCYVSPPSLDLSFMMSGTLPPGVTFARASTATYFDAAGTLQTATTNTPRWDYDPVARRLNGLLMEVAGTNLLLNSATLGTQSVAVTAQSYALSFYGTGTITLSGTSTAGPLVGAGAMPARVSLIFTPTAGTLTLTVTGSVLNAQLEAATYPTSYIPTAGASATRAAEGCSTPTGAWFNAAASSMMIEYMVGQKVAPSPPARDALSLSDGTLNNRLTLRGMNAAGGAPIVGGTISSASTFTSGLGPIWPNAVEKLAAAYNGTTVTGALNGIPGAALAFGMPAGLSVWTFGYDVLGTASYLNGWVRRTRYWPRALSGNELRQITR